MKKRHILLPVLLVVSSILVAIIGGYIKYGILAPLGIERDERLIAMPFVWMTDDGLRFTMEMKMQHLSETSPSESQAEDRHPEESIPETMECPEETTAPCEETTTPAPETEPVYVELDESWFDDALFIGDSRTAGLRNYYRLGNADYFTNIGMNIYNVFTQYASDTNFPGMLLEDLLQKKTYGKIYIGIGLNECNYEYTYIEAGFSRLIEMIKQYQPDAKIIMQSIMMVSENLAKSDWYFDQENLGAINDIICSFCDGETVFYIDYNEVITDENGYLPGDLTFDGIHLFGTGYEAWAKWIMQITGTLGIA